MSDKTSPKLAELLAVLREGIETSSPGELQWACQRIIRAQSMTSAERDTIIAAFRHGPLFDGDVPSKTARDGLLHEGFLAKVVVKGEDSFNACTNAGAWIVRLLEADA